MTLVGFGGEEQFERDIGWRGWVRQKGVWLVVWADIGTQFPGVLVLLLEEKVLLCHIVRCRLRGAVRLGIDCRQRLLQAGIELGPNGLQLLQAVLGRRLERLGFGGEKSSQRARRTASKRARAWLSLATTQHTVHST